MDLSYHIEELLYTNDCVIIPTIGGFIVNYAPASIDFVEQQLLPPQKAVSFNVKLVNNDGLLANHIAQKEHLTYKQATLKVEDFSRQIEVDLFNNKIVHFDRIGKLYFNADSKLEFVPSNTNFLKDAYGLPNLSCAPILRSKDYLEQEKVTPVPVKQKAVGIFTWATKPRIAIAAACLLFALASPYIYSSLFGNSSDANNTTAIAQNNTDSSKKETAQASFIPSLSTSKQNEDLDSLKEAEDNTIVDIDTTTLEKEKEEIIVKDPNSEDYIIVLGAFGKKRNADRLAKKLAKDNYLPEVTPKNGLSRVGVQITCTPEELVTHLNFLQENYNPKAWVVD